MKPQGIAEHLNQVKDYITSINESNLDINALYIAQAYLTKLQASLRPNILLSTLFLKQDLETMFQLTFGQGNAYRDRLQYNQRIICEQLLKYFKTSNTQLEPHSDHSLQELGQLMQRILESLQEWSVIGKRVKKMQAKFQRYRTCLKESEGLRNIEEGLEEFLDKLLTGNNRTQFTTVQSQNRSFSIQSRETVTPQGLTQVTCPFLTKAEVIQFLGYLSMWLNQLNHEICEYKSVLQQTKSESSIDEREFKFKPKKNKVAKTSLLTSKLKEGQLDIPKIDHNFFDEKENHSTLPKRRSVWIAPMSEMNCTMKGERTLSHRVILGNFNTNQLHNKQKVPKSKGQSCTQCQIY